MANKAISELPQALNVNNQDLFVLEQSGIAKKLTAETFITEQGIIDALAEALDGHGGIQSVTLQSLSGRIRTYQITFTDETASTFQVLDGTSISSIQKTSTAGLVDTYTIFLNDGSAGGYFQVRNGQDGSATWDQINSKAPVITDTATGAVANFPDGADDIPVADLVVNIEPKQSGSGDPSPDNIRPITGFSGANVYKTRTNLVNQDVLLLGTSWAYSESIPTFEGAPVYVGTLSNLCGSGKTLANAIPVTFKYEENTRYRIQWWWRRATPSTQNGLKATFYYTDGTSNSSSNQSNNTSNFIRQGSASAAGKTISKIALTYNSSSSVYIAGFAIEKYDGTQRDTTAVIGNEIQTTPIDWTTEAGTVYGGSLDVTTGVLTVTDGYIASYDGETLPSTWISDRDVYASGTTPTTGAQVVYKLETPITYQLTPQQLKTVLGTNGFWANTGATTVKYRTDTKLYIEKLTMPTEDDMVANQAIASGKFFMIGNSLFLSTAAIANGAQIIEGTNATRLSLADALNQINS